VCFCFEEFIGRKWEVKRFALERGMEEKLRDINCIYRIIKYI
jgi:hypothetical protein